MSHESKRSKHGSKQSLISQQSMRSKQSISSSNSRQSKSKSKSLPTLDLDYETTRQRGGQKLKPIYNGMVTYLDKYDCCAFIIHCAEHDKIMITNKENVIWMPFTLLLPNL